MSERTMMLRAFLLCFTLSPVPALAEQATRYASSPPHRVALLELYTSEGCSSCPPADRFITTLKESGIGPDKVIPLAFHVTYWDYIGWRDRFGHKAHDNRQRQQARLNASRTVYTPQFMLNGRDYRRHRDFSKDIGEINAQTADVSISMQIRQNVGDQMLATLDVEQSDRTGNVLWLAVFEHDLQSDVTDGENEGERLNHDYVVRRLYGPYALNGAIDTVDIKVPMNDDWKPDDLGMAAFVQRANTSEIVQATSLTLSD